MAAFIDDRAALRGSIGQRSYFSHVVVYGFGCLFGLACLHVGRSGSTGPQSKTMLKKASRQGGYELPGQPPHSKHLENNSVIPKPSR